MKVFLWKLRQKYFQEKKKFLYFKNDAKWGEKQNSKSNGKMAKDNKNNFVSKSKEMI